MKTKRMNINVSNLREVENVRNTDAYDTETLAADITANGLREPLEVAPLANGAYEILCGHRRYRSCVRAGLEEIPCIIYDYPIGADGEAQRLSHKVDHGNDRPLTSPVEVARAASMLYRAGKTEGEVLRTLAGLYDRVYRISGTVKSEIDTLRKQGNVAEADKRHFAYHRGSLQCHHHLARLPQVVFVAWSKKHGQQETIPAGYALPRTPLTDKDVQALAKAYTQDAEARNEAGGARWSRESPGPLFVAVWDKITTREVKPETAAGAGMSRKEIAEAITSGRFGCSASVLAAELILGKTPDANLRQASEARCRLCDEILLLGVWPEAEEYLSGLRDKAKAKAKAEVTEPATAEVSRAG